jgi:hypothetical protein
MRVAKRLPRQSALSGRSACRRRPADCSRRPASRRASERRRESPVERARSGVEGVAEFGAQAIENMEPLTKAPRMPAGPRRGAPLESRHPSRLGRSSPFAFAHSTAVS